MTQESNYSSTSSSDFQPWKGNSSRYTDQINTMITSQKPLDDIRKYLDGLIAPEEQGGDASIVFAIRYSINNESPAASPLKQAEALEDGTYKSGLIAMLNTFLDTFNVIPNPPPSIVHGSISDSEEAIEWPFPLPGTADRRDDTPRPPSRKPTKKHHLDGMAPPPSSPTSPKVAYVKDNGYTYSSAGERLNSSPSQDFLTAEVQRKHTNGNKQNSTPSQGGSPCCVLL